MSEILDDPEGALAESLNREINDPEVEDTALSLLSSGQSILVHFVTSLLAWLEPNSLVLFDEPETHLHPNAVASLFNVLTAVLQEYESFAIIATHSPIVIQEIPAKRMIVFRRDGNSTVAEPLLLESFGESLTELTRHVFETNEISTLYRRTLSRLAREENIEQTIERFERELSLSAQAFLIAQHEREDH
jgi:predicted ATP-dependent endonuclease of OLD family